MNYYEVNFDGLVGPTHNYAGLAEGNLASASNSKNTSFPKAAALQGLEKMKALHELGIKQAILPPLQRPHLSILKKLGYSGKPKKIIAKAAKNTPDLLASVYSSSSMWTANCATVSPSTDTKDQKLHLTPANLISNFHRSIEAEDSYKLLKLIFSDPKKFKVHQPLPSSEDYSDEGAANHMRLSSIDFSKGIELFVYGKEKGKVSSKKYPARQHLNASIAIIRTHKLCPENSFLLKQSPKAIEKGVFHNDVISTGNANFLLTHESAFSFQKKNLQSLSQLFKSSCNDSLIIKTVSSQELSIEEAIKSYLFNSQIVSLADSSMVLIAPEECRQNAKTKAVIDSMILHHELPLNDVKYFDLKQSMSNGGGPACLRLRVLMNDSEIEAMNQNFLFSNKLYKKLKKWINKLWYEH